MRACAPIYLAPAGQQGQLQGHTSSASLPAAPHKQTRPRSCKWGRGRKGGRGGVKVGQRVRGRGGARRAAAAEASQAQGKTCASSGALGTCPLSPVLGSHPTGTRAHFHLPAAPAPSPRQDASPYSSLALSPVAPAPSPRQDAPHNECLLQADEQTPHAGWAGLCRQVGSRSSMVSSKARRGTSRCVQQLAQCGQLHWPDSHAPTTFPSPNHPARSLAGSQP